MALVIHIKTQAVQQLPTNMLHVAKNDTRFLSQADYPTSTVLLIDHVDTNMPPVRVFVMTVTRVAY